VRVVLLGAPGAGKGTQAKRLAERFDMLHLSSGDILRAEKASGSELGAKLAKYMDVGELVPDAVVVDVMAKAVSDPAVAKGLLLDGFPRTVEQARALDEQLEKMGTPLDVVVAIDIAEEVVVERICGRRSCPKCGEIYHVKHLRPKVDGVCDECGFRGGLVQRADDTEQVVRTRMEAYNKQTAPLLEYYRIADASKVVVIDGNGSPDQVAAEATAQLEAYAA